MKTDHEALSQLIHACLDGRATEAQVYGLNVRLREDAAARDLYLQLADTHSCLSVDEGLWMDPCAATGTPDLAVPPAPNRWFVWRPLLSAAAGIVVGMLCTTVVFAYVVPSLGRVRTVFVETFESGTATAPGLPREEGKWGGDEAVVVGSTPGLKPRSGKRMLRFLNGSHRGENSPRSQWGDVYRLVDVRGMAGAGRTLARVSAGFSQGSGEGEGRFSGSVEAFALEEELSTLPSPLTYVWLRQNNSASSFRRLALSPAGGWQDISVEIPVTPQTQFVLLHLAVSQDAPKIPSGVVQFPSQYMDDVKLELLNRP